MIVRAAVLALLIGGVLPNATGSNDESLVALRHNPFTRPELGDARPAGSAPVPVATAEPELRATLVAGKASLANVGGELLAVGDEVDGYRLIRIGEGYAEFVRGAQTTTVFIRAAAPKDTRGTR